MPSQTKGETRKKVSATPSAESDNRVCFVISPIGDPGTDKHAKFKDVLEYVIKSAVNTSGYTMQVLRADDIDRAGSFIKDILENLYSSFVVIADLTGQNPNVFYELGVRHCLSSRTILIARQSMTFPATSENTEPLSMTPQPKVPRSLQTGSRSICVKSTASLSDPTILCVIVSATSSTTESRRWRRGIRNSRMNWRPSSGKGCRKSPQRRGGQTL